MKSDTSYIVLAAASAAVRPPRSEGAWRPRARGESRVSSLLLRFSTGVGAGAGASGLVARLRSEKVFLLRRCLVGGSRTPSRTPRRLIRPSSAEQGRKRVGKRATEVGEDAGVGRRRGRGVKVSLVRGRGAEAGVEAEAGAKAGSSKVGRQVAAGRGERGGRRGW